jgi:hypothetical protein
MREMSRAVAHLTSPTLGKPVGIRLTYKAATMAGSRSLLDLALGYAYRCSGAKSGVSEMADEQGRGTGALNFERIYSTTVPAEEVARALADHFRMQEFEAQCCVSILRGTFQSINTASSTPAAPPCQRLTSTEQTCSRGTSSCISPASALIQEI